MLEVVASKFTKPARTAYYKPKMAAKAEMDTTLLDDTVTFQSDPFPALLDPRVLRALADLAFTHPTLVQTQAIPLILQGKDVLAKARTGSGKTAAYGLPAVQRVLLAKEVCDFPHAASSCIHTSTILANSKSRRARFDP